MNDLLGTLRYYFLSLNSEVTENVSANFMITRSSLLKLKYTHPEEIEAAKRVVSCNLVVSMRTSKSG